MKLEISLENLAESLSSARQILLVLAGFSIGAIYLVLLSGGALRQELAQLDVERQSLNAMLVRGDATLAPLRDFYEGPVEADKLNFGSFIYALDITNYELELALAHKNLAHLSEKDLAFLEFEADLIRANITQLRAAVGGLISQKNNRIPFDSLPIADVRDLDYHKGKDAWGIYGDYAALRYALQTPASYGFQTSTANIVGLENRFTHYQKELARTRAKNVTPPKAGHTPAVTDLLSDLTSAGFRTMADARSKLAETQRRYEEKSRQSENSLKLPFLDQPIDASTLGWVIPVTALVGLMLCIFYLSRARELFSYACQIDASATRVKMMYPWVYISLPGQPALSRVIGDLLLFALAGAPIFAGGLFLVFAIQASGIVLVAAIVADVLVIVCFVALLIQVSRFRSELRRRDEPPQENEAEPQPPVTSARTG